MMDVASTLSHAPDQLPPVAQLITALMNGISVLVIAPAGTAALLNAAAPTLTRARTRVLRSRSSTELLSFAEFVPASGKSRSDQSIDALTVLDPTCDRIALLVDDAHLLSHDALRYIEAALSTTSGLRVALAGQPELLDTLAQNDFSDLRKRFGLHIAPVTPQSSPSAQTRANLDPARMHSPDAQLPAITMQPAGLGYAVAEASISHVKSNRFSLARSMAWFWGVTFGLAGSGAIVLQVLGSPTHPDYSSAAVEAPASEANAQSGTGTSPVAPGLRGMFAMVPDQSVGTAELRTVDDAPAPADAMSPHAILEPEMVTLPGTTFRMGSVDDRSERPPHAVTVKPFQIARYAITVHEWQQCVQARMCTFIPRGQPDEPVTNVSWNDARQFVDWLSDTTGRRYRLPTEAEWEYAARGGSETRYSWGNALLPGKIGCKGCDASANSPDPPWVYAYPPNQFGLYGMGGGAAEWVADCWHRDYHDAPRNGSVAWDIPDCRSRVLRGGSWRDEASDVRVSSREHYDTDVRYPTHGFRVAASN